MPAASAALVSTEKVEYNIRRRLKLSVGSVKTASSYCSDTTGFFEFCWGGAPRDFWSIPSGDAGYNFIWWIKSMGCSSGSLKNTLIPASNSPHPNSDTYECGEKKIGSKIMWSKMSKEVCLGAWIEVDWLEVCLKDLSTVWSTSFDDNLMIWITDRRSMASSHHHYRFWSAYLVWRFAKFCGLIK